ncbi:MAG: PKD domain-containing protein [Gemmatimonadales bacterium]
MVHVRSDAARIRQSIAVLCVLMVPLVLACSSPTTTTVPPPPPPPPVVPPPRPTAPPDTVLLVDRQSVPTSGGQIVVSKPGSALDGLTIRVPTGAYPGPTMWTVRTEPSIRPTLPAGVEQVGAAVRIGNGADYADSILTLTLPAPRGPDEVAAAFYYDPATGTFEFLPLIAAEQDRIRVATRHFSAARLLAARPASFRGAWASRAEPGEAVVVVAKASAEALDEAVDTGFRPGADDWEFLNYGSYAAPGGFCSGATITAIHHFYTRKATLGPLFGMYDKVQGLWSDNPQGIRAASAVQGMIDYSQAGAVIDAAIDAGADNPGWMADQAAAAQLALKVTGAPQFFNILKADRSGSHAIVGYAQQGGTFQVADPNNPGQARQIEFRDQAWVPFSFSARTDLAGEPYAFLFPVGISAIISVHEVDGIWADVESGSAGTGRFPGIAWEFRTPADTGWVELNGSALIVGGDEVSFRALCQQCSRAFTGADPIDRVLLRLFSSSGAALGVDTVFAGAGPAVELKLGDQTVGLQADGPVEGSGPEFIDFQWLAVTRVPFELTANDSSVAVGTEVTFTLNTPVLGSSFDDYQWDFGDGSPAQVLQGKTEMPFTYEEAGRYTARVGLLDDDGRRIAVDSVTITVGVQAWQVATSQRQSFFSGSFPEFTAFMDAAVQAMDRPSDGFFIARSAPGGELEDVVLLWVERGTGLQLQEVPTGPGSRGIEWVVARGLPVGTLLRGETPFSGSGELQYGAMRLNSSFEARFENGELVAELEAPSVGFPSPYYGIGCWRLRARPFHAVKSDLLAAVASLATARAADEPPIMCESD